jgi:hypothetical protein
MLLDLFVKVPFNVWGFLIPMVVNIKIAVFWNVMMCGVAARH